MKLGALRVTGDVSIPRFIGYDPAHTVVVRAADLGGVSKNRIDDQFAALVIGSKTQAHVAMTPVDHITGGNGFALTIVDLICSRNFLPE